MSNRPITRFRLDGPWVIPIERRANLPVIPRTLNRTWQLQHVLDHPAQQRLHPGLAGSPATLSQG